MTETKLKPCPFCNGEPTRTSFNGGLANKVICTCCGIGTLICLDDADVRNWNIRVATERHGGKEYGLASPDERKRVSNGSAVALAQRCGKEKKQ